jgi:beta-lactamase superfamily II metal-dependent hydrolase
MEYEIDYFSTADNGTITVRTDGNNWKIVEK